MPNRRTASARRALRVDTSEVKPTENQFKALLDNEDEDELSTTKEVDKTSITTPPSRGLLRVASTPPRNSSVRFQYRQREHSTFLKVRLQVQANNEGATGVSDVLGKLLSIIQVVDSSALLAS